MRDTLTYTRAVRPAVASALGLNHFQWAQLAGLVPGRLAWCHGGRVLRSTPVGPGRVHGFRYSTARKLLEVEFTYLARVRQVADFPRYDLALTPAFGRRVWGPVDLFSPLTRSLVDGWVFPHPVLARDVEALFGRELK